MTEPAREERAFFSSAVDALRFALNFEDTSIPSPVMTRAMVEINRAQVAAVANDFQAVARKSGITGPRTTPPAPPKNVPLGGTMDRAILAGWILQKFMHLDAVPRLVLTLTVMKPRAPCACGAPCCRGWLLRTKWVEAVRLVCEHLKEQAELIKEPGKRGFSSDPRLRQALVEDWAKPPASRASVQDLINLTDASYQTVVKHRLLIQDYLHTVETMAWTELALIFEAHGVTGQVT